MKPKNKTYFAFFKNLWKKDRTENFEFCWTKGACEEKKFL